MTGLVLIALLIIVVTLYSYYQIRGIKSLAPWIPSNLQLLNQALTDLNLPAKTSFIDLGAGDGRAVFLAAQKFNLRATGVELAPLIWLLSQARRLFYPGLKIELLRSDLYKTNLRPYSIIYCYGLPETINKKILSKLQQEIQPGGYFLTYDFPITDRPTLKVYKNKWRTLSVYKF